MKMVLHAGTHKTATTTFQAIALACRDLLAEAGVMYPQIKNWPQHSRLSWALQAGDEAQVAALLQQCVDQARDSGCNTVLLSGEDFENCLIDVFTAPLFESMARAKGITQIDWVFVVRSPMDYLLSIYATMSKHRCCLDLNEMASAACDKGYVSVSNGNFNYHFVFNARARAEGFSRHVPGKVTVYEFDDFVADFTGRDLLRTLVPEGVLSQIACVARQTVPHNMRLKPDEVEKNYACNALGIPLNDKKSILEHAALIERIMTCRQKRLEVLRPGILKQVSMAFKEQADPSDRSIT